MTANSAILRELAAQPRTFRNVKHAILWYRDQLAGRLRTSRDVSDVGTPRSRESIDIADATFAAIAQCLRRTHPADHDPESAAYLASGERLLWLVASYEARWGDNTWLADKAKLTRWSFTRLCRRTERVLHVRLEYANLLEGE